MITEPVYLENVHSVMRLEEVPQKILVPNPGGRKLVIKPEASGYDKEQVFTSDCLPHSIPYELLGLVKFPDGSVYPKYRANVVTSEELDLNGEPGYQNGIDTINKVAWWLTWQKKMLEAKSIKKSDIECFDYKSENLSSYWLASPGSFNYGSDAYFGPGAVFYGRVFCGNGGTFNSNGYWYAFRVAVRPVMTLASKVQIDPPNITWVSL